MNDTLSLSSANLSPFENVSSEEKLVDEIFRMLKQMSPRAQNRVEISVAFLLRDSPEPDELPQRFADKTYKVVLFSTNDV